MRPDLLELIGIIFEKTWELFLTPFPGTNFPVAAILIGVVIIILGISLLSNVLGFSFRASQRGGNNKKVKVSEDRKNDSC